MPARPLVVEAHRRVGKIAAIGGANYEDRLKRPARPCRENPAAA
jgi:hypothetical protein